jgi:hypothetical protein
MAFTLVTRLSTDDGKVYSSVEQWKEDHGMCGTTYPDLLDSSLELEEGGTSVLRTLVYVDEAARNAHVEAMANVESTSVFYPDDLAGTFS